jgi:hypothetical protein
MQTNPEVLRWGHKETTLCREGQARKNQYTTVTAPSMAFKEQFTAYGEELKKIEVFKYLDRLLEYDDNDARTVTSNLCKTRKCGVGILKVLRLENAPP